MTNSTAFLTDKYELTMLQAALQAGKAHEKVSFELFARRLPQGRRYGVVSGTARAIEAVLNFHFSDEQIEYLKNDPIINDATISFLKDYKFEGKIVGYREGDVYFPNSPLLTVTGTFADSVLLETVLLSILNHDSAVASAASRMVVAARGLPIIEMGSRRTHEIAAVDSARAAICSGFTATSNLEAGIKYGVPTTGTSAHAFTLAFEDEKDAFKAQVEALGVNTTLLVDTYDIPQGIKNAIEVAGTELGGIRIDSGDLHEETVNARKLLDSLGAVNTKIVLSSDIDEYTIAELLDRGTPVDVIGAGTRVVTGSGHPTAGMVYKLIEREDNGVTKPVFKNSSRKKSIGGRKVPFRTYNDEGIIIDDFYVLESELVEERLPKNSHNVSVVYIDTAYDYVYIPTLEEVKENHIEALKSLPDEAKFITAGNSQFETTMKGF